jgi:hypothetical protein
MMMAAPPKTTTLMRALLKGSAGSTIARIGAGLGAGGTRDPTFRRTYCWRVCAGRSIERFA